MMSVAGGGAWGTALAIHAARMGHKTLLWAREADVVASVNGPARENTAFLPVRFTVNLTVHRPFG